MPRHLAYNMGDRPLIVVILWLPVTVLRFTSRVLEFILGSLCYFLATCLHFCLLRLMLRTSAFTMLVTGFIRGLLVFSTLLPLLYLLWWQLNFLLREHISLWISLPTDLLCILLLITLTIRGLKGKEIRDFRPYIVLTLHDFVSVLLTLLLMVSIVGLPRWYVMPKAVLTYHSESIQALFLSLIDLCCLLISLPMLVLPWRLKANWESLLSLSPVHRIPYLSSLLLATLADVFFIVPLLLVLLTLYRLPRLLKDLYTHPTPHWRSLIIDQGMQVFLDIPFFFMSLVTFLCIFRAPGLICALFRYMNISTLHPIYQFMLKLRSNVDFEGRSIREIAFICFLETILTPVLLLELVILQLTVYRFPKNYSGLLLCNDTLQLFYETNKELWEFLLDLPFILMFLLVFPCFWRSYEAVWSGNRWRLDRFLVWKALFWAICDVLCLLFLAVILVTILRIGTFLSIYRKERLISYHWPFSPFHTSIFFSTLHIFLDLLHLPFLFLVLLMPWRYSSLYLSIKTENDPDNQRKYLRNEVKNGLKELLHVLILLPFAILMPWELLTLRNCREIKELDMCKSIQITVKTALGDFFMLPLILIPILMVGYAKNAVLLYFRPLKGGNLKEIEEFRGNKWKALGYYIVSSGLLLVSVAVLLVIGVTLWRIPSLHYVLTHAEEVKPQFEAALGASSSSSPANPLLSRSSSIESLIGLSLVLGWEWVKDLPYLLLALITPVWRLYAWFQLVSPQPFHLSQQAAHRKALMWSSRTGCLDILSLIASVLLIITLWRLVFFHRLLKKNAHLGYRKSTKSREYLSFQYCVLITFREWLKDLPYVPIGLLITVFAFWRLPQIVKILIGQKERIPTIKNYKSIASERQKLLKMLVSVVFFDYPTLVMTLVLIVTLWRAVATVSLLKLHAMKHFVDLEEEVDSTLFREITAQFCQLGIDALEVGMMVCVLGLGVRAGSLIKRVRTYVRIYKERKGFDTLKIVRKWCPKKETPPKSQVGLASMSKNILFEISTMLELPDLGKLQQTCRYLHTSLQHRPIWHNQYTSLYSQYLEKAKYSEVVHAEYDYKHLAVEGYKEYKRLHG